MSCPFQVDATTMNRRDRLRFETDLSVNVTPQGGIGMALKGRLKNLSAHGLGVILSRNLPLNSRARIEWGDTCFDGRVIYCKPRAGEFLTGFRVDGTVYDNRQKATGRDCACPPAGSE
jgi:hypothetical protein